MAVLVRNQNSNVVQYGNTTNKVLRVNNTRDLLVWRTLPFVYFQEKFIETQIGSVPSGWTVLRTTSVFSTTLVESEPSIFNSTVLRHNSTATSNIDEVFFNIPTSKQFVNGRFEFQFFNTIWSASNTRVGAFIRLTDDLVNYTHVYVDTTGLFFRSRNNAGFNTTTQLATHTLSNNTLYKFSIKMKGANFQAELRNQTTNAIISSGSSTINNAYLINIGKVGIYSRLANLSSIYYDYIVGEEEGHNDYSTGL